MVNCCESFIIYGWCEGNDKLCIDHEWISDFGIHIFTNLLVDNHVSEIIYGIPCEIDNITGKTILNDSDKNHVDSCYKKIVEYMDKHNHTYSEIGFFNGVWSNNFNFAKIKLYIPTDFDFISDIFETPNDSLSNSLSSTSESKNNTSGNEGDDEKSL